MKAPSTKHQASEKLQASSPNRRSEHFHLKVGIWSFSGAWCLVLGAFPLLAISPDTSEIFSSIASRSFTTNWARSASGQFIVTTEHTVYVTSVPISLRTNINVLRLNPTLVAVSAERIRKALCIELNDVQPWRGQIYVMLHPVAKGQTITLAPERFSDGWSYRLDLPDYVERASYAGAMVHVLLMEMANRAAQDHCAEIPLWLSHGLSRQLLATSPIDLLLTQPSANIHGLNVGQTFSNDVRLKNPLLQAHQQMHDRPPLSFEELSWPTQEPVSTEAAELYQRSAQLFVTELLSLRDGAACLRTMLAELPRYYNWQFAFLRGFHTHFERPLDVEKWWTLHRLDFAGRDLSATWSSEESWRKLDEVLHCFVEIRTQTNSPPLRDQVTLQTILRQWDRVRQEQALRTKLRDLDLLRFRVSPEFIPLVDDYRKSVNSYLQNRDQGILALLRKGAAAETIAQLNALDERRLTLRPKQHVVPALAGPNVQEH